MIRLRLLGPMSLEGADGSGGRAILDQPKRLALLAYLSAVHPPARQRRDVLVGLLWPEQDDERARMNLRQTLHRLRRSLGRGVLVGSGRERIGLDPERLWCDAAAFTAALEDGRGAEALQLYRGDFLQGFHVPEAVEFERWMGGERRRFRRRAVETAWNLAEEAAAADEPAVARRWGDRALELAPYDDDGVRRYVALMVRLGQSATALRAYDAYADRLREDLELEPSVEIRRLIEGIRARTPPASAGDPAASRAIRSLAVLPFEDLSRGGGEQEWFAAGMHAALISELGRIRSLEVTSRTSALRFANRDLSIPEIADVLGVDGLVEGSVLRTGTHVRVSLQLIDASSDRQLWARSFDRELRDVLILQGEVAAAIAEEIQIAVDLREDGLGRNRPVEPEAYTHYLRGNGELKKGTEAAFQKGLDHYHRAIAIDSLFAPAYAGLALAYIELGSWMASLPPSAVLPHAREAAMAALERDPDLAEAHIALGRIKHLFEWDWEEAEASLRRGISLNPSSSHALWIYANYLTSMGRFEEAVEVAKRLVNRDPLSAAAYAALGWALEYLGRDDEALQQYQRGMTVLPHPWAPALLLAEFHLKRGRPDSAYGIARRAAQAVGPAVSPTLSGLLGFVYGKADHPDEARRVLETLQARAEREYVPPNAPAVVHVGLGQYDQALDFLEAGVEMRDATAVWNNVRWVWDPIRDRPRFEELLRKMGFPAD